MSIWTVGTHEGSNNKEEKDNMMDTTRVCKTTCLRGKEREGKREFAQARRGRSSRQNKDKKNISMARIPTSQYT